MNCAPNISAVISVAAFGENTTSRTNRVRTWCSFSPDVAEVFPDADAVNEASRALIKAARQSVSPTKRAGRHSKHAVEPQEMASVLTF